MSDYNIHRWVMYGVDISSATPFSDTKCAKCGATWPGTRDGCPKPDQDRK